MPLRATVEAIAAQAFANFPERRKAKIRVAGGPGNYSEVL